MRLDHKHMNVDRNIHFIWLGGPIPKKYIHTILSHVKINQAADYKVHLWTDNVQTNKDRFVSAIHHDRSNNRDGQPRINERMFGASNQHLNFDLDDEPVPPPPGRASYALPIKYNMYFMSVYNSFLNNPIDNRSVESLRRLYNHFLDAKNYGGASDVLRTMILAEMGGIYMDIDVYPEKALPRRILAKDGFLAGYGQASHNDAWTNAVMACGAGAQFIESFAKRFVFNYNYLNGAVNLADAAAKALMIAKHVKVSKQKVLQFQNNKKMKNKAETSRALDQQRMLVHLTKPTVGITGPAALEIELCERIRWRKGETPAGVAGTQIGPIARQLQNVEQQYGMAYNTFGAVSYEVVGDARTYVNSSGLKDDYKFPAGFLRIESDNSWLA